MRALAIDPGSRNLGWSHMVDKKVVMVNTLKLPEVKKDINGWADSRDMFLMLDYFMRMQMDSMMLQDGVGLVMPTYVIIETFFPQNFRGATVVPEVRAVIKLNAYKVNIPIIEVSPSQVKKFITGIGNADKDLVRSHILEMYPNNTLVSGELDDNAIDSIAIGLTGIEKIRKVNGSI